MEPEAKSRSRSLPSGSAQACDQANGKPRVRLDDVGEAGEEVELRADGEPAREIDVGAHAAAEGELRIRKPAERLARIAARGADQPRA